MTHTPRPWKVSSFGLTNDGKRAVVSDDAGIAWVHPQTAFKRGEGWRHDCPEREANANLIAAAPDLLALVELVHGSFGGGLIITFSELDVTEFAAAIAKARGRE